MVPTKAKDLIGEVAKNLSIPEEDLNKMVSFYYKENKRLLVDLEYTHVVFRGLGTMHIKGWDLEKYIKHMDDLLIKIKKQSILDEILIKNTKYKKAKEKWDAETMERRRIGALKKQYYDNKLNQQNDTQGKNTGSLE